MKKLFAILLICSSFYAHATTYYFSASGNDLNNGNTTTAPWKTLAKFNSVFASKSPGDNFLFNRGDVFYGGMTISRSGSSGLPITIGAYGSGAAPVITGFTTVSAWTNLGSNIWESTSAISTLAYTNMVVINGVNVAMGSTPLANYTAYSGSTTRTLTSSSLSGFNWVGGEVAYHNTSYTISRDVIKAHSGSVITFDAPSSEIAIQGNSNFIIQNHAATLNLVGEWYYNPSTKRIRIYNTVSPTGVEVTTQEYLATLSARSYITFDNINFRGANTAAIYGSSNANHVNITNCSFTYFGRDAVFGHTVQSFLIEDNTFDHTNSTTINLWQSTSCTVRRNHIDHSGVQYGMGSTLLTGTGFGNHDAIAMVGSNNLVEYNDISDCGKSAVNLYNNNTTTVQYNLCNNAMILMNDGGAIYAWNGDNPTVIHSGLKILHNIIIGSTTQGIYMDDRMNNVEIGWNTIKGGTNAIFIHNNFNMNYHDNTTFDAVTGLKMTSAFSGISGDGMINNDNIYFARTSGQMCAYFDDLEKTLPDFVSDNNYYARPIAQTNVITYIWRLPVYDGPVGSLSAFQTWSIGKIGSPGVDVNSHIAPRAITDAGDIRFEYNATPAPVTINLVDDYEDVKGVAYPGIITLGAYESAVLIFTGTITTPNVSPSANAGVDQTITLPTTSATMSADGTDVDGTIASYNWLKYSGPGTITITYPGSQNPDVSNLQQGVYLFILTVTDNLGATGNDTVQITVNGNGSLTYSVNISNPLLRRGRWNDRLTWTTTAETNVSYYLVTKTTGFVWPVQAKGDSNYTLYNSSKSRTNSAYTLTPVFSDNSSGTPINFQLE